MPNTPTGTVTFLFTDLSSVIEGGGLHAIQDLDFDDIYVALFEHPNEILRSNIEANGGYVFGTSSVYSPHAAFHTAREALEAVLAIQRAFFENFGRYGKKAQMALHTGAPEERAGDYFGPPLARVEGLMRAAHGGQVLLSEATYNLVRDHLVHLEPKAELCYLGEHRLKDLKNTEHIYQLVVPDLPKDFPPLKSQELVADAPPKEAREADFKDRYRFKSRINSTVVGMEAHLAHDEVLGRDVVVKVVGRHFVDDERFKREARNAAKLSHSNIVQVYDWGETKYGVYGDEYGHREQSSYYVTTEYVAEGALEERLRKEDLLPPAKAISLALQVARALQAAHTHGVIHRDVKPENILLTESGEAKVADFGIASTLEFATGGDPRSFLAPYYTSPEQLTGEPASSRSDLYALGAVLYEMLTGEVPYYALSPVEVAMKHVNGHLRPPKEVNQSIPEGLNAICVRLLAKDPEERYQDAAALIADLERVRDEPDTAVDDMGPATVEIPDFIGQNLSQARSRLANANLKLGSEEEAPSLALKGMIIEQDPEAGTKTKRGSVVSVTVSSGPRKASAPPTGTVTFLFTDMKGAHVLWENYPTQMPEVLKRHDEILKSNIEANGGYIFHMGGDAFAVAFHTTREALQAALAAQRALFAEEWPENVEVRVRMGLHTGVTEERDGDYFGTAVNRVARLMSAGHGGQILLSGVTYNLVRDALSHLEPEAELHNLGEYRLRDLKHTEHIFQLVVPDLPKDFPPLKSQELVADAPPKEAREADFKDRYHFKSRTYSTLNGMKAHLARDEVLDRDVGLKMWHPWYVDEDWKGPEYDEEFVERFKHEVRSAARLSHPNIAPIHDWGETEDGACYVATEYLPGGTLKERILQEGPLPALTAVELTLQIARALDAARRCGVIHGDVQPRNVLLTESGEAKVADFGIARLATQGTTEFNDISALRYSPDQMGERASHQSDLYALGIVLYEMLTGELLFDGETLFEIVMKHENGPLRPPKEVNPGVPEGLNAITVRLLAKEPEERYQDAAALIADLEQVLRSLEVSWSFKDRYRFIRSIGSDTNIWLAHDEVLDRDVAIKVPSRRYADDERFVERFKHEAESAASLSHPNIVSVHDRGKTEDGDYYMAMEYVSGGTLRDHILKEGPLPFIETISLVLQIAEALQTVHQRGLIHRDLKPHNVLLTESGEAKVTDFGIARSASWPTSTELDVPTETSLLMGTPHYMSPEQMMGESASPASDLYSLGVVLYEMLTGELPHDADTPMGVIMKHVSGQLHPPREVNPDVPEEAEAVALRLLAREPKDRYPDAAALIEGLKQVLDSLEVKRTLLSLDHSLEGKRALRSLKGDGDKTVATSRNESGGLDTETKRALEQLNDENFEIRFSAISALGRIARDSEETSVSVVEALTAYIREHAPWPPKEPSQPPPKPLPDIEAALSILKENLLFLYRDLHKTPTPGFPDLRRTDLRNADLSSAVFYAANLQGANLIGANFKGAVIGFAIRGATFSGAKLQGVDVRGTDIRRAEGLTQEQITQALGDKDTLLPEHLQAPPGWEQGEDKRKPPRIDGLFLEPKDTAELAQQAASLRATLFSVIQDVVVIGKILDEKGVPSIPSRATGRSVTPGSRLCGLFEQPSDTVELAQQAASLRVILFSTIQDVVVLKQILEEKGMWDQGLYRRLRIERMIDDYYSAGPLWFGRYSYYPYLPDKSNEEKADELIRRGSLIDTKSFDIFLDSADTEALTRRVTALRGTLFNGYCSGLKARHVGLASENAL